jgi:uncharacterized protein YecA (UPF0149 family)
MAVVGYHWLGIGLLFVAVIAFVLYEFFAPPHQYRKVSMDEMMKQGIENGVGIFGKSFRQFEPDPLSRPVGRNDRCPCGSGAKYKRCCERVPR